MLSAISFRMPMEPRGDLSAKKLSIYYLTATPHVAIGNTGVGTMAYGGLIPVLVN